MSKKEELLRSEAMQMARYAISKVEVQESKKFTHQETKDFMDKYVPEYIAERIGNEKISE